MRDRPAGWPCFNPGVRAVIQRVSEASVAAGGEEVGRIGPGLLVLVAATHGDTPSDSSMLAERIANLRIFADPDGKMNLSVLDTGGQILVVSQFTLYADARKGRRPSFVAAADPAAAETLIDGLVERLRAAGPYVQTGSFGEAMRVRLVNDGPVTIILETLDGKLV